MRYDPGIHNRRSIRLRGYDYSQEGYYFVTICTQNRQNYFQNKSVSEMVEKWWGILPDKFSNIEIDEFIVMPDHIHGIIAIVLPPVEVDQCVYLDENRGKHIDLPLPVIIQWFKTMTTNEYI